MAACPWCTEVRNESFFNSSFQCYCTSPSNPGNKATGNTYTGNGVAYGRCRDGQAMAGIRVQDCPFYRG